MKANKLLVGILTVSALLLSGCGASKKHLVCTQKVYDGTVVKFDVSYSGKSVSKLELFYDLDLDGYSESNIAEAKKTDFCAYVKSNMSQYKFVDCKDTVTDKHINVSSELDKSIFKSIKIDDAKKQFESVGYTCNIEK